MFGFMTVVSLYSALGFSVICTGLCWYIGFADKKIMHRVAATSALLIVLSVVAKFVLSPFGKGVIAPFGTSLMIYANVTYFLALLIVSNRWYSIVESSNYIQTNVLTVVSLIVAALVGAVANIPSCTNTAIVFGFLYMLEKIADRPQWPQQAAPVVAFLVFVAIGLASLFLKTHPDLVVTIVTLY
jgi:hypothetical protein